MCIILFDKNVINLSLVRNSVTESPKKPSTYFFDKKKKKINLLAQKMKLN